MKTIEKIKQKFNGRGSVLVFTLIVMSVILVSAMGIAAVSVIERRTSSDTGKSTQSFQVADSGAEIMLQKIYKGSGTYLQDLVSVPANCAGGVVSGDIGNTEKSFKVTFYKEDGTQLINCGTDKIADVRKIKSVGTFSNTARAVEVAVAASCGSGAVTFKIDGATTENFTAGRLANILSFLNSSGVIAGVTCSLRVTGDWSDGGRSGGSLLSTTLFSADKISVDESGNAFYATLSSTNVFRCMVSSGKCSMLLGGSTYDCLRGWAVIGFCN